MSTDLKLNEIQPKLNLSDVEMIFGTPDNPIKNTDVKFVNEHKPTINVNNDKNHKDSSHHTQPLLEPAREKQKPPLAGPEIDDLDDEKPAHNGSYPGIDDGLLEPELKNVDPHHRHHEEGEDDGGEKVHPTHDDGTTTDEGKWWLSDDHDEPDYPYDGYGINTRFGVDDRPISPIPGVIPDVNTYQQKKNLAQGMMDLALFTANVNQLRYVIETSSSHPYYYFSLASITLSLLLQVAVAVGLIMNSRYDVKDEKDICKADKINNLTVLGIFLVTIVNVFIASFSVAPTNSPIILPLIQAASNITRA